MIIPTKFIVIYQRKTGRQMKSFNVFTGKRNIAVNIPDDNFLYFAEHKNYSSSISQTELICNALDNPIGAGSLEDIEPNARVVIIFDDTTRPTPCKVLIPHIVERVLKKTQNITFVTAPGTHRPLSKADLSEKLGEDILAHYPVVNIDYTIDGDYNFIGDTEDGTPLYIHRAVLDADYKIAVGNIGPHNVVGWSGGAKMLQPGVSGRETTNKTHLQGAKYPILEVFGNENCHMRGVIDKIGALVGLDFIVNTVLDSEKNILGLFCGHYFDAHRKGVAFAQKALRPEIPELADIVIVSAYPSNVDYWQGFKPIGFSMFGVKKGGTVIYLFDPKEGLCNNSPAHKPMLLKYLKSNAETVWNDVNSGKVTDIVGVTNPLYHFQVLDHIKNVLVVSDGLTDEECDMLTFERADSIDNALNRAFEIQGRDAKVGVIPFGG
ncbi:MAG: nickel-dependent lactate racemase, partial [Oscillospiraceae bacterium]